MKKLIFIFIGCIALLLACNKVKTSQKFPDIENGSVTALTASQIAWLNQVAKQKADSLKKVDSAAAVTGTVDPNSLFHKKNMLIALVGVNDRVLQNAACYVDQNGKQVFDVTIPFSANLNLSPSTGKPYVSYNPEMQAMIRLNKFKQLQQTGMKVGLSLLGNHDPACFDSFMTLADATAFAQLVAFDVRTKGYDAVMTDDEYSSPTVTSSTSYPMVMSEIKRLLPDIYLIYYDYTDTGVYPTNYNGKQMGDICDADFTPFYPEMPYTNRYNFAASKCFGSSSQSDGSFSDPVGACKQIIQNGNAGIFFFNVEGISTSPAFYTPYALGMKGVTLTVPAGCLDPTETDFANGQ